MNENVIFTTEDVKRNKIYGILSYLGILVLVPILGAKDSLYARFHANQGLCFLIFSVVLSLAGRMISFVLKVATFGLLNNLIHNLIFTAIGVIVLVFMIIGIVNACSGEAKKLPLVGGFTLLK